MSARTDIHRPVEMDPADYEYLYADDNQRPGRLIGVDMDWWRSITNWDPATADRNTNQCHHCGARIRYFAILRHIPTGYSIAVGETCLDGRFELQSKAEFDRLRKAAELDRQKMRIKTAAREFVDGLLRDGDTYTNRCGELLDRDEETKTFRFEDLSPELKNDWAVSTFGDIRSKIWNQYGQPTPRQLDLLVRLVKEGAEEQKRQQELRENPPVEVPKVEAPSGRVTFEGKVVFRKGYESDYGYTVKIVVVVSTPEGEWSVFVTEPSAIETKKGDIVRMTATLTPGELGKAKGSRPAKAEVLVEAGEEVPSSLD